MNNNEFDVIIIGAGPAGLNAALYTSRAKLKTLIIEKELPGGKINSTNSVENYIGIEKISGFDLAQSLYKHALSFGAKYKSSEVVKINYINENNQEIIFKNADILKTKKTIIASGMVNRIPYEIINVEKFLAKGISFCGVCDGPLFKDKIVFIQGGGNSAYEEALFMTKYASHVSLIVRDKQGSAEKIIIDEAEKNPNITVYYETNITKLEGDSTLSKIFLKDKNGNISEHECQGLFPMIGFIPNSKFFDNLNITNDKGFIETDELMRSKLSGIYAIGDIRDKDTRQIITAASDGAVAAKHITEILK